MNAINRAESLAQIRKDWTERREVYDPSTLFDIIGASDALIDVLEQMYSSLPTSSFETKKRLLECLAAAVKVRATIVHGVRGRA